MIRMISLFLCLLTLTSCTVNPSARTLTNDKVSDIIDELENRNRLISLERQDINFLLSLTDNDYQNAWLMLDEYGATIDEIGIFIATEKNEDILYQKLEAYVKACQSDKKEWLESYNQTEAQKLKNGKLFRYGRSMGYVFLSSDDQNEFLEEIDDFFKGKEEFS